MRYTVWLLVLLLLILHQDNWFWSNPQLVFGFMPIGLFYHACISIAAGITWFLAIQFAWPAGLDAAPAVRDAGGVPGTVDGQVGPGGREGQA